MKSNLAAVAMALVLGAAMITAAAPEGELFSAGEPGDLQQPARVIKVTMREDGKKMLFEPAHITANSEPSTHGTKRTFVFAPHMSAFGGKADIA